MDKDRIKGKVNDIAGRAERQAGEWTGDKDMQAEGVKDQAKGKTQNTWGKVKDAARDLKDDVSRKDRDNVDRDADRDIEKDDAA